MVTDPFFYAVAVPAVILLGLAKGGFSGIGVLGVPLMTLAISPVRAAAIALPILIVQDVVSVWAFRKNWSGRLLAMLIPSAAAGIFAGYALAAWVKPAAVEAAIGAISVLFGLRQLWIERGHAAAPARPLPRWLGPVCGAAAGFTSQVSHAGGPPFQIYVMPMKLPRDVFIGTSAIFFAVVNWMKVPAYIALGQFSPGNLLTSAALGPLAIASTYAGVVLVRRVDAERFYKIVYLLLVGVGAKLLFDGLHGLLA
jgi:uncharacterized membrane protein YfcA